MDNSLTAQLAVLSQRKEFSSNNALSLSLLSLFRLRPLRDPGPNISGGSSGQTYPSTEKPGDAEPRRPVGHHIHQAAAQTS